jgi:serine/threonine protein kinase
MSRESIPPIRRTMPKESIETIDAEDIQVAIDDLLEAFPEESRQRIEDRMDGLSPVERVSFLEAALRRRRELLAAPKYTSSHLHMLGVVPSNFFSEGESSRKEIEVGRGENGRVFEFTASDHGEVTMVYKMLIRTPMEYQNDLMTEAAYQADVAAFAETQEHTRIAVPHTLFVASSSRGYVLAMEKVRGYSIRDIIRNNVRLPDGYDYEILEQSLRVFLENMNDAGFYHRDIREGNIMIDLLPPDPFAPIAQVIDFGFCVKASSRKEAYQKLDGVRDHVTIKTVIDLLRNHQRLLRETP